MVLQRQRFEKLKNMEKKLHKQSYLLYQKKKKNIDPKL